jgi:hypothetical protein
MFEIYTFTGIFEEPPHGGNTSQEAAGGAAKTGHYKRSADSRFISGGFLVNSPDRILKGNEHDR